MSWKDEGGSEGKGAASRQHEQQGGQQGGSREAARAAGGQHEVTWRMRAGSCEGWKGGCQWKPMASGHCHMRAPHCRSRSEEHNQGVLPSVAAELRIKRPPLLPLLLRRSTPVTIPPSPSCIHSLRFPIRMLAPSPLLYSAAHINRGVGGGGGGVGSGGGSSGGGGEAESGGGQHAARDGNIARGKERGGVVLRAHGREKPWEGVRKREGTRHRGCAHPSLPPSPHDAAHSQHPC
ncbi:hypothetical protein CLOP_g7897 [Closterium sp. NIES-67]|nr:hypothetical protein CLOP_g7897 [Closterium sp. NIES-67]